MDPAVPIQSLNSDLWQKTELCYTLDDNGNRTRDIRPKPHATRTITLQLPLFFNPAVWGRHGYSFEDVITTVSSFSPTRLWQLALLLGLQLPNSSMKISFATPNAIEFCSKASILHKLTRHLEKTFRFADHSVLDKTHEEHVPPIPIHRIPVQTYHDWKRVIATLPPVRMLEENVIPQLFRWRDIWFAPMGIERNCLYLVRAIPVEAYRRRHDSLITQPLRFRVQDTHYFGVLDEASFFLPQYEVERKWNSQPPPGIS